VEVELTPASLNARLTWWERAFGLMGDLSVPRSSIERADVVADGLAAVAVWSPKVGIRIPGVIYVAQTLDRRRVFIVRRGEPALVVESAADAGSRLLVLGTPRAAQLSAALRPGAAP